MSTKIQSSKSKIQNKSKTQNPKSEAGNWDLVIGICLVIGIWLLGFSGIAQAPEFTYVPPQEVVYWQPPAGFGAAAEKWTPPQEFRAPIETWTPPPGYEKSAKPWGPPKGWSEPPEEWAPPGEFRQ